MVFESTLPEVKVPDLSLGQFFMKAFDEYGSSVAVIDAKSGSKIKYEELLREAEEYTDALIAAGLKKGDIFGAVFPVTSHTIPLIVAVLNCGATICGCRMTYKWSVYQELELNNPCLVVVDDERFDDVSSNLYGEVPSVKRCVCFSDVKNLPPDVLSTNSEPSERMKRIAPDVDTAFIFRSSGTTGEPKGIACSHKFFVACAGMFNEHLNCTSTDVNAIVSSYISGYFIDILASFFSSGSTLVLLSSNSARDLFDSITKYKISCLLISRVLDAKELVAEEVLESHEFESLRLVLTTGTSFPPLLLKQVKEKMGPHVRVVSGLGSTESGWISISKAHDAPYKSAGQLLPGVKIKVVDPKTGHELGVNETGVLLIKSPTMLTKYMNKSVEECFEEGGWFDSGDEVRYDASGYLYVLGRQKENIFQDGLIIKPIEIDGILQTNPKIKDAAICEINLSDQTKILKAFVVKNEQALTEAEVLNYLSEKVESSIKFSGGVQFVDHIPRAGLGKVQRYKLKQMNINKQSLV